MATAYASDYVLLRGGLAVPVAPLLLLFQLEERGLTLAQDGDDLIVRPRERLTADDCQQIRRWKMHLLALLAYEGTAVQ